MAKFHFRSWFRNISISKKLYFTIGIMAFLIVSELCMLWISLHLLSGVRGAIQVEGIWSKAQKSAVNTLQQYAYSADTVNYRYFVEYLEVHELDKKALLELKKTEANKDIMLKSIVAAGVHPGDAKPLVDVFYYFHFLPSIERALEIFWVSDDRIIRLRAIGNEMHRRIMENGQLSPDEIASFFERINFLNSEFKSSEGQFINTISKAGRWIDNMVFKILFTIAITVEITGLIMAISINRGISKGINEVIRVAKRVGKGNYKERAQVYSKDEIGVLAQSFNTMIDDVEFTNQELNQFVYIASHDLQEPLNTIGSFTKHLFDPNTDWDDSKKQKVKAFIGNATLRMQNLIRDLMNFSRIGHHNKFEFFYMNQLMEIVLEQLHDTISRTGAKVQYKNLPKIYGNKEELIRLFQNLISNAIKFQNDDTKAFIQILHEEQRHKHVFTVKDNGIGIQEDQQEKIFEVFQRLHSAKVYPGTGIGLAICKKIVHLHKGRIWVVSEFGKGSEFKFSIPKS